MKFKKPELEQEFASRSRLLKDMAYELEDLSLSKFQIEPVITRVLESIHGSSGVHEQGRAIDLRSWIYNEDQIKQLVDHINFIYRRSDGKPTLYYHSFQGGALHLHLQVAADLEVYGSGFVEKYI